MNVRKRIFDPVAFKETTRNLWDCAVVSWNRWAAFLSRWLGPATELMLDMANVQKSRRVLDAAAGAGDHTLAAARRTGPSGFVLATDLSPAILEYAAIKAKLAGYQEVDGAVIGCTLYLRCIIIDADGTIANNHRKLMPTNPECMV